ncbi:MAG: YidC/Oxa1 family membrane protein insertase [Candidatus Falkowbacteria bacterium]
MSQFFTAIFYQPILNLLVFLYNVVPGHDIGLAIIIMTAVIKLILLPLSKQSIKSQRALQELQPKIDEIKKKYADKKEEQGKAMMELYKQEKVNPFSSCLPLLIQLPFLWAVFMVFRAGLSGKSLDLVYPFIYQPEFINTMSLGFIDLAKRNVVLAVLAGLAQFWQAKMMTTKRPEIKSEGAKDENMMVIMNKQMLYMMPALTVFIGLSFPGGLALYWLVTTLLTALQQLYLFKKKEKI